MCQVCEAAERLRECEWEFLSPADCEISCQLLYPGMTPWVWASIPLLVRMCGIMFGGGSMSLFSSQKAATIISETDEEYEVWEY